jgi:hypothetical protein
MRGVPAPCELSHGRLGEIAQAGVEAPEGVTMFFDRGCSCGTGIALGAVLATVGGYVLIAIGVFAGVMLAVMAMLVVCYAIACIVAGVWLGSPLAARRLQHKGRRTVVGVSARHSSPIASSEAGGLSTCTALGALSIGHWVGDRDTQSDGCGCGGSTHLTAR